MDGDTQNQEITPKPPPGFKLDAGVPKPPPGFKLDQPAQTPPPPPPPPPPPKSQSLTKEVGYVGGGIFDSPLFRKHLEKSTPQSNTADAKFFMEMMGSLAGGMGAGEIPGIPGLIARMLASGSGATIGNIAGQQTEKAATGRPTSTGEALETGAGYAAMEGGGEVLGKVAGKVLSKSFLKDLFESKVNKLEKIHTEKLDALDAEYRQKLAQHQEKVTADNIEFKQKLDEHKQKVQGVKDQYAQDIREYQKKAGDVSTQEVAAQAKKGVAVKHQQELAGLVKENLELANKKIGQQLGDEFNIVQEAVNAKSPKFNYRPVANAVAKGRAELVLPDSNKILNAMMGPDEGITGLRFDTGRTLYTKLNDYLYGSSELPMDVYRAVKGVRDALGQQLQESADSVGLGGKYSKAMRDWSGYKSEWADRSALAKGGSPILRILTAEDPSFVIDQVSGKAGDRLIETLGKYSKYGADPTLAGRLKGFTEQIKAMPSSAPVRPKAPIRPTFPKEPTQPAARKAPVKEPAEAFNRDVEARKILIDRIRKAAGIGTSAYVGDRILRYIFGGGSGIVP